MGKIRRLGTGRSRGYFDYTKLNWMEVCSKFDGADCVLSRDVAAAVL